MDLPAFTEELVLTYPTGSHWDTGKWLGNESWWSPAWSERAVKLNQDYGVIVDGLAVVTIVAIEQGLLGGSFLPVWMTTELQLRAGGEVAVWTFEMTIDHVGTPRHRNVQEVAQKHAFAGSHLWLTNQGFEGEIVWNGPTEGDRVLRYSSKLQRS